MKANQAFKEADDAVSPVIGVILMVAITVVLAAVVFVLVGNLTDTSEAAPTVVFTYSDSAGTARVTTADTGVFWGGTGFWPTCAGAALITNETTPAIGAGVSAGDQLTCATGAFSVVHNATNTEVARHVFP
jgi:flagellin-like protein